MDNPLKTFSFKAKDCVSSIKSYTQVLNKGNVVYTIKRYFYCGPLDILVYMSRLVYAIG